MNATFKDVAKLANVSTQTVSRVTNGSLNVAEETRKRVLAAIKELDYVPNKGAQILGRAKSKMIGIVTLDILHHGASLLVNGVRQQAKKLGYGSSLSVVSDHSMEHITAEIDELKSHRIEFIVINIPLTREEAETLTKQYSRIYFVFIDVPLDSQVNSVCSANYEGAVKAAEFMISQQRKRFLLVTGPSDSSASNLRLQGWRDVIAKHADVQVIKQLTGNWQSRSGYQCTRDALSDGCDFDAVLVASDQTALGVLRALSEFSVNVPKHVSVIGFDDTADSAYFSPPLTTIRQDFLKIGERSVSMALNMAEETPNNVQHELISTQLIERKTTQLQQKSKDNKQQIRALLKQVDQLLSE